MPTLVVTEFVVLIDEVLKGEIPRVARTILLCPPGGRIGESAVRGAWASLVRVNRNGTVTAASGANASLAAAVRKHNNYGPG